MQIILIIILLAIIAGCTPIKGERFWWNDQKQAKLESDYELADWPAETPLKDGEKPYVDRKFPRDEVKRAQQQEKKQITAGVPRCGVPDPLANPVPVKVAQWVDVNNMEDAPAPKTATADDKNAEKAKEEKE